MLLIYRNTMLDCCSDSVGVSQCAPKVQNCAGVICDLELRYRVFRQARGILPFAESASNAISSTVCSTADCVAQDCPYPFQRSATSATQQAPLVDPLPWKARCVRPPEPNVIHVPASCQTSTAHLAGLDLRARSRTGGETFSKRASHPPPPFCSPSIVQPWLPLQIRSPPPLPLPLR